MGRGGFEPPKALGQLIYSQSRLTTSVSARPGDSTDNRQVPDRRSLLWQGLSQLSLERCIYSSGEHGSELSGVILQATNQGPMVARYTVEVDLTWITRAVTIVLENGSTRRMSLSRGTGGSWLSDGKPIERLDGCIDVDLEWTPATNSLPIRRLQLAIGSRASVRAAWVRFPALTIEPLQQTYERRSQHGYRYRAGDFQADLEVDDAGLVLEYSGGWRALNKVPGS
jgi:hypothetical protein